MPTVRDPIAELGQIAQTLTGVQFTERSREMIKSRLQKRMSELKLSAFEDYLQFFLANRTLETPKFVALLTTHHTYFFREFAHFDFIQKKSLPALLEQVRSRPDRTLRIWSAACSRGQEVYSLAMFLELHLKALDPTLKFEIFGTDIDAESVEVAKNGVYLFDELKEVPLSLLGQHWVRGKGDISAYAKVSSALKKNCAFQTANLFELGKPSPTAKKFDLIFCRNVFIYFNQEQIKKISQTLLEKLNPDGFLFIGISESLLQMGLDISSSGPSIYQHKAKVKSVSVSPSALSPQPQRTAIPLGATATTTAHRPQSQTAADAPKLIRVLCVDDSPVILSLLGKIFTKEEGFQIVGTAANGLLASEQLKLLKPDAVTLDIHMPEQTGIEYLEKNYRAGHPPVVMVTSVARENSELAGRALSLGAADYVEKPALSNLAERAEEIRNKVRCSVLAGSGQRLTLDRAFQRAPTSNRTPEGVRIILLTLAHRHLLKSLFKELSGTQPGCLLLVDGAQGVLASMADIISKDAGTKVKYCETVPTKIGNGEILFTEFSTNAVAASERFRDQKTSILVYGDVTKAAAQKLSHFQGAHLVLQDLGSGRGAETLMEIANDVVLPTSFAYLSNEFLTSLKDAA